MSKITTYLLSVLSAVAILASCTDQKDIDISYEQTVGITAAHIFESFTPFENGDFDLQKEGWTLNIDVLFYDTNGNLVTRESFKSNRIDDYFKSSALLSPAEYTVVAIAHFSKDTENYRYWNISNESTLNDLSIDETADVYATPFETLGIHTEKITVSNRPLELNIDIKPTTALFEIYEIDKMLSYLGYKGKYSVKCLKVTQYNIRTVSYQNNVRFKDGKPSFNRSEQTSDYDVAISRPFERMDKDENPSSRSYRALLPESAKQFSWTLYNGDFNTIWLDYIKQYLGSYPTEGRSESKDIVSGHQYSLAFMLDAGEFVYEDITGLKYNIDDAVNEAFDKYQTSKIDKMVNFGFEHMIGTPAKEISQFIGVEIDDTEQLNNGDYIVHFNHSPETVFEQMVAVYGKEPTCESAYRILLQLSFPKEAYGIELGKDMPESVFQEIWNKLNAKFYHFMTVGNVTMFLDGPTKEESKAAIILDGTEMDNVRLFFDDVKRHMEGYEEEVSSTIKKVFPYEWQTFLRQEIDSVIEILGPDYETSGSSIYYNSLNDLVSSVCITPDSDNKVKSVDVQLRNYDEEDVAEIRAYLEEHFYPTVVDGLYTDSEDMASRTMTVSNVLTGHVTYNVYPSN